MVSTRTTAPRMNGHRRKEWLSRRECTRSVCTAMLLSSLRTAMAMWLRDFIITPLSPACPPMSCTALRSWRDYINVRACADCDGFPRPESNTSSRLSRRNGGYSQHCGRPSLYELRVLLLRHGGVHRLAFCEPLARLPGTSIHAVVVIVPAQWVARAGEQFLHIVRHVRLDHVPIRLQRL